MAKNKIIYNGNTLIDLTGDTVTADKLLQGYTAHDRSGALITGTATGGSAVVSQDQDGYLVLDNEAGEVPTIASLNVTQNGTYTAPTGVAYSLVTVDVPSSQPTGIKYVYSDIDGEGAWDCSGYAKLSYDCAPLKDNRLRYWVELDSSDLTFTMPVSVPTYGDYRYTGMIDWGDDTEPTEFKYGALNNNHTYQNAGRYVISAWWTGGSDRFSANNPSSGDKSKIIGVELYLKGYPTNGFDLSNCANLIRVSITSEQTRTGNFYNCAKLKDINIPNTITEVNSFYSCPSLEVLTFPASVTTVASSAFRYNTGMKEYHFLSTTPPTLGTNVFTDIPSNCKIYVPSASLEAYQTATNWSTYASYMVGE